MRAVQEHPADGPQIRFQGCIVRPGVLTSDHIWALSVDDASLKKLERLNFRLYCGFGQVHFRLKGLTRAVGILQPAPCRAHHQPGPLTALAAPRNVLPGPQRQCRPLKVASKAGTVLHRARVRATLLGSTRRQRLRGRANFFAGGKTENQPSTFPTTHHPPPTITSFPTRNNCLANDTATAGLHFLQANHHHARPASYVLSKRLTIEGLDFALIQELWVSNAGRIPGLGKLH
nr:unnamed protein product [Callosobruchus analis]